MIKLIDTHTHLDGEEFTADLPETIERAKSAGVEKVLIPAINLQSVETVLKTCRAFPDYAYPMIGLHPEDVKADYVNVLCEMKSILDRSRNDVEWHDEHFIAIGEIGLDYYWSREFEREQLDAFEQQIQWAVEYQMPLMIHCRKAQNEMLKILKQYKNNLCGGVFHCFTGNEYEAKELLEFDKFMLGIGGVLTFKKSHLPEVLPQTVPLNRILLETDSPYMAPVPYRGKRNESAFVLEVAKKLAECYNVSLEDIADITTANAAKMFNLNI